MALDLSFRHLVDVAFSMTYSWNCWHAHAIFFLIGKKQIYYKAIKNKETQGRRFQIIHRKYTKRNPKG